ncbi:hypothetical protein ACFXJO_39180 [Streptomyces lavendulae]|uniref:hypothetical protein n=1 Tax=Streptomyces TaxID=1883 RepID=UPI0024739243|nr:hypothetical protein [Streptomyces sp. SPB4]MDH6545466.1 hypothetical protein [Streptomyces sp. SPB4]
MNSEEPRQGWPTPPGYPPSGPAYGAPGGPPPTAPPAAPPSTSSHRGAWIGAGATLVAAVIGVVGTYMVAGNTGPASPAKAPAAAGTAGAQAPAAAPQDSAPQQSSPSPVASAPAASASRTPSGKPPGTVQWEGPLLIEYAKPKDLDAAPPVDSKVNADNDFAVFSSFGSEQLRPAGGAKALVWEDPSKTPSYEDCAGVVDTLGTTNDLDLKTGRVFCGKTKEGRVVRLTAKQFTRGSGTPNGTFDVVVWGR